MGKRVLDITPELIVLKKTLRVAVYARVSCEKDTMIHSLKAQIDYYKRYIEANPDYEFVGVFADEAKTGTKESREEFQALLTKCKRGEIDMIITKSISRFARNTVTLLATIRELKELGIDVFFEDQNMHSLSEEGEMMLTLLAGVAQEESLDCSEAVKWRIRKKYEQGETTPFKMLGYRLVDGEIVVEPTELDLVKRIFNMYLSGLGTQKIANILAEEGIKTRTIKKWSRNTIIGILTNEKYKGDLKLQKSYVENHITKKKKVNDGVLPQYYVENNHEAIIDKEIWDTVNELMKKKKALYHYSEAKTSAFTSKLLCSHCGSHYGRKINNGIVKWQCRTYDKKGKKYCASKSIREDILKGACNIVLNLDEFSEEIFIKKIHHIEVCDNNLLIFYFNDGLIKEVTWNDHSRKDSWTKEMKDKARERSLKQYGR